MLLFLAGPPRPAAAIIGGREEGPINIAGVLNSPHLDIPVDLPRGHLLLLDLDASIYGSPLDPVLQMLDPNQQVIAENDADVLSADSALGIILPTAGRYTIRLKDTVTAQVLRLASPGAALLPIELKIWVEVPGFAPITFVNVGADGSVVVSAGFNQDFGPRLLFPVAAAFPRGPYAFNCRILAPVTGGLLTEDLNPFALQ